MTDFSLKPSAHSNLHSRTRLSPWFGSRLVSSDPCHNTLVNFEVSLQHGRRALRKIRNSQGPNPAQRKQGRDRGTTTGHCGVARGGKGWKWSLFESFCCCQALFVSAVVKSKLQCQTSFSRLALEPKFGQYDLCGTCQCHGWCYHQTTNFQDASLQVHLGIMYGLNHHSPPQVPAENIQNLNLPIYDSQI